MNKSRIKTIAVVTPGGDAPGMNTAIRAVVRAAIFNNLKVYGIERGWRGLIDGELREMTLKSVGGIINRGGTILHTVRYPEFMQKEVRKKAFEKLKAYGIDGLVVIGGDGSLRAAYQFYKEHNLPIINIPASIDNDIYGTDYSIGFDTAVNTALDAVDKIRDTATSHERLFIIEVMGREKGFLALEVGLVCGAEEIIIPEIKYDINKIAEKIKYGKERGKTSFIIVLAEGAACAEELKKQLQKKVDLDIRLTVLGHIQRGGSPTANSRESACKLGARAVELLIAGKKALMVGLVSDKIIETPVKEAVRKQKKIDMSVYKLANMLAS